MSQIVYNVAASLDGFIAPPDESTEWIVSDTSIDFKALYARFDLFIMGRKTYDAIVAAGEYNLLRGISKDRVFVISRTLAAEEHPSITVVKGDHLNLLRAWKFEGQRTVWVMGGGWLAGDCLKAGLLTSVEIAIMPVVLGNGFKLLDGLSSTRYLVLKSVQILESSGILMTTYETKNQMHVVTQGTS